MKAFETSFNEYMKKCFPGEALHVTQYTETQQAFYAGVLTAMLAVESIASLPDKEAQEKLEQLMVEAAQHVKDRLNVLNRRN